MNGLAWILATHPDAKWRDGAQAVTLAERCVQATQNRFPPVMNTLAAAYAEVGRDDDAVRVQVKAIEMAKGEDKASLQERLKLYQAGKPYREKR